MVHTLNTIATRHVIINLDKNYQTRLFQIQKLKSTHKCKGFKQHVPFCSVRDYAENMWWGKTGSNWRFTGGISKQFSKIFISNWCSVIIMRCNTTDEYVRIKTFTVHKLYNSVCDQKWSL